MRLSAAFSSIMTLTFRAPTRFRTIDTAIREGPEMFGTSLGLAAMDLYAVALGFCFTVPSSAPDRRVAAGRVRRKDHNADT